MFLLRAQSEQRFCRQAEEPLTHNAPLCKLDKGPPLSRQIAEKAPHWADKLERGILFRWADYAKATSLTDTLPGCVAWQMEQD